MTHATDDHPEHVRANRSYWDGMAHLWVPAGTRAWAAEEPYWGVWALPISDWLRLFRRTGFEVLDYLELQAPAALEGTPFHSPAAWGKRWPYEHVWKLRKQAD